MLKLGIFVYLQPKHVRKSVGTSRFYVQKNVICVWNDLY